MFADFTRTPLAAASIAQVHAARLPDGRAVVVKVLRPNVAALIQRDVELLYVIAAAAERYWPEARRLRPVEVVREFERTLAAELDLMREAANASQLEAQLLGIRSASRAGGALGLLSPERADDRARRWDPVDDMDGLRAAGTDIKRLAENGVEIFFTQVFRHNFFHADMHPGNIFVDVTDPKRPKYVAVDFGIVGTLDERDKHYLAENFLAFFRRDYRRVASLHVDSAWVPAGTRVDELESAVRAICEPIFNKPIKDISFGLVLMRLFQTARQFDMEIQPQLVLLQKTLLQIEGLGRQLYPELDLWKTAKPVLEQWMRERHDPRTRFKQLVEAWPEISDDLAMLPRLLHRALRRVDAEDAVVKRQRRAPIIVAESRRAARLKRSSSARRS